MTSDAGSPLVGQANKKKRCEEAALDAGGCDGQTSAQAADNCDFIQSWHEVAPACDVLTDTQEKKECFSQTTTKQIQFLKQAALEAGLASDGGLAAPLVPSRKPAGELYQQMQSHYTFFNINIFKLGPVPVSQEPLFLLGDAAHAPNFLSGCGVVGGQDDSAAVGHYSRWLLKAGTEGWPDKDKAKQCSTDMLKVVQNLVFERSCKYSECHEHEGVSFLPQVPGHTVHGDVRYQGKSTEEIALLFATECSEAMRKISK